MRFSVLWAVGWCGLPFPKPLQLTTVVGAPIPVIQVPSLLLFAVGLLVPACCVAASVLSLALPDCSTLTLFPWCLPLMTVPLHALLMSPVYLALSPSCRQMDDPSDEYVAKVHASVVEATESLYYTYRGVAGFPDRPLRID